MLGLADMLPFYAMHDLVDRCPFDAVFRRHFRLGGAAGLVASSDPFDVFDCQLGVVSVFTALWVGRTTACLASFADFIRRIRGGGAKEKVVRTHTGSVIAVVADLQAVGDWPEVQCPREAMRHDGLPIDEHLSISSLTLWAIVPAPSCFLNAAPETLLGGPIAQGIRAFPTAKTRSVCSVVARIWVIFNAAVKAIRVDAAPSSHSSKLTQFVYAKQRWAQ